MCHTSVIFLSDGILGAIAGGAIGLVGSYCGYRWNRRVSIETIQISEFNKAASVFRAEFTDEMIEIRNATEIKGAIDTRDAGKQGNYFVIQHHTADILRAHEKAKILFEPYVTDLKGFDTAWYDYTHGGKYSADEKDPFKHTIILRDHLNVLLRYAAPKKSQP